MLQFFFSDSSNKAVRFGGDHLWHHSCILSTIFPVLSWLAVGNLDVYVEFKKSHFHCCQLGAGTLPYPQWILQNCAEDGLSHLVKVVQFFMELRP